MFIGIVVIAANCFSPILFRKKKTEKLWVVASTLHSVDVDSIPLSNHAKNFQNGFRYLLFSSQQQGQSRE